MNEDQETTEHAGQLSKYAEDMPLKVRNRNALPNLRAQREELVNRITKIDKLINLLENNPDFVKMLDLSRELL